jgi:regulation of enolase protein 1 (concanavalin A-like superfamily)
MRLQARIRTPLVHTVVLLSAVAGHVALADPPTIDVWYGPTQTFGQIGQPQNWVNILGNVSDPDGIASLSYTLNGGPARPLSIGPDNRRLVGPGDFNVDPAWTELLPGANQIEITAVDTLSNQATAMVTLNNALTAEWPLPYAIDWSTVTNVLDVAQPVDGDWLLTSNGVRTGQIGYDRLLGIGDLAWTDYEVTVPITVHGLSPGLPSGPPGLGVLIRWTGHTDNPIAGWQPKTGYLPIGTIGWWRWNGSATAANLQFFQTGASQSFTPQLDVPYLFKIRVSSTTGLGGLYQMKVWPADDPEPQDWNLEHQSGADNLAFGSALLIAHYADATFGNVTVNPLPLSISNVQATLLSTTSARITWETNNPASSKVDYGLTTNYEIGSVFRSALVTDHGITLSDLTPDTEYYFQVTSEDAATNSVTSGNHRFTTTFSNIVSDDFNDCAVDTNLWTLVDPVGDVAVAALGTFSGDAWLALSVPQGVDHDAWVPVNRAPRIMQAVNNADFEVEVKFASELTLQFQEQGLIIEEDPDNFLRFDFYSSSSQNNAFVAAVTGGNVVYSNATAIPAGAPMFLRVKRSGDSWTQSHSSDGQNWTVVNALNHAMTVSSIGPFVGNASGGTSPAHTALIDYFENTAAPLADEDGQVNPLPGDLDNDCDIDLDDHGRFASCLAGPAAITPPGGCTLSEFQATDLDADGDCDLADFAIFARGLPSP